MMGELGNGVIAPTTPVPSLSEDKGKEAVSTPDSLPKTEAGTAQPIQDKTSGNELSEQNKDKDNLQQTSLTGASQDASTSTVARAPGDALSYQVATPNDNGVVAVAPQVSNPSLLAENPDGTTLDVLQDNKALEQFIERIKAQQQEIDQLAVKQKEEIQAKAETQKQALLQSTETQISQLEQVRAQTLQQITQSAAQNRSHIITQRDNEIQAVNSATDTELASLEQTVIKHQSEVRQAAADNANTARSKGEQEAARAISNCTAKASMAMSLGASKAAAYTKSKRYPDIFEAAMQIANDAAQQIRAAGSKMADTAKNDANKLAAKFVKEGEQVASSFLKSQDTGKLHIHQSCLETIQKITIKAAENLTHIDTAEQTAANQLTSKCSDISQQLRQSAQQILPDIDEQAKNACLKVDETSNQTKSALDQFIQQVQGQFGNYPDELIEENLAAADNEISSILKGYEDGLNQIGNDTESSIQETINQKVEQIATQATQITEIIQQVGLDFEAQATNISSSFTQQASEAASKSKESMLAIVTGVDKNLAQSVKESTAKWTEQLTQGIGEIKKKIVEGLAQQDKVLDAKEANRLENESLLDRSKAAVGYLIGGFLSEAREFINSIGGILKNSLPVLISVLAIVTVITILALLAPAIVLPIIFGLFVVLEFIFDVAAICFFASASVGFLSAIYVVFFSGQSLSDRERWDMLGRSVFNVSLAYIGVVAAVTRVFGLFKTVGTLGRLLTMVKSPFELIGLLLKAGSVKRLETLLVLVGDSKRLSSLLKYYGDAKKFEAALQAVGNNVDELEKMINQAGGDLSKAREILGSGTRSPRLLENNIGQWKAANESMSPPARDYQQQITGRSGEVYLVDGVKFDGFKSGVLLEAKGPGYADFIENGKFEPWFRGKDAILKQAENQIQVAKDTHIEWHVAEKEAANAIKSLFEKEGFERIEVIYTPTN